MSGGGHMGRRANGINTISSIAHSLFTSSSEDTSQDGQAIVEFAVAFPIQLLIMLSIMQLALIFVGQQVVTYSAYKAARSALVARHPAEAEWRAGRAAALVCSPITGTTIHDRYGESVHDEPIREIELPGWGAIPKSGISSALKTHVSSLQFSGDNEVEATVTHYYELTLPIVGFLFSTVIGTPAPDFNHGIGRSGSPAQGSELEHETEKNIWRIDAPHIRLRSTARAAMPGRSE